MLPPITQINCNIGYSFMQGVIRVMEDMLKSKLMDMVINHIYNYTTATEIEEATENIIKIVQDTKDYILDQKNL